ncbi:hypothetical protein OGAPHI_003173 [Ogataea philodendri]|uniref:D-serine dehydratase n=1 Tax=Ogataea philodendri TaxID=1378263 RepID=A0A9P8P9R7_9ASCO|nr:uncharacterized protein OGAPHI_003173 [Ogataea philodendri]KAH3667524.1 hypothetical protein OGAPHI_003173 [Ogataea philodendri]
MKCPSDFTPIPPKDELLKAFKGANVQELPTPAFVVDRSVVKNNSDKMLENARSLGLDFRAHVKTHKTLEGTLLQLGEGKNKTDKIVVSTLREAWGLLPLIEDGKINDILFSLPVVKSRLPELEELSKRVKNLRLMLDNIDQIDTLVNYSKKNSSEKKWSIFVKVNMGTNRAGYDQDSLGPTLRKLLSTDAKTYVSLYGFYCHAGHSYGGKSEKEGQSFLLDEISSANYAAKQAREIDPSCDLHLSVGATPTAHASAHFDLKSAGELYGKLELHAGNYPFCDLQQMATGFVSEERVACRVLAEVLSTYPGRGPKQPGEQLINAGVIALTKEVSSVPGYGKLCLDSQYGEWVVGRLSQEHGILAPLSEDAKLLPNGAKVKIIPQHSCITAASYPWYYIVDGDETVCDIWVPFRGW